MKTTGRKLQKVSIVNLTYPLTCSIIITGSELGGEPILLKTKEVAEYLKISDQQVRRLVGKKELPCIRISQRALRFRKEDVEKFISGREI
jgi:excisionase family DNA binding protein